MPNVTIHDLALATAQATDEIELQQAGGADSKRTTAQSIIDLVDITLTGDATGSGNSTIVLTLEDVNNNVGTFGSVVKTPVIVANAKGQITAITESTVTPAIGSITGFGTGIATFLASPSSGNLAAALTNETGTGSAVFATSPTLVTPILGTPQSGNLSNCVFPDADPHVAGAGYWVAGVLTKSLG